MKFITEGGGISKAMTFFKGQMSEADGTPSNNRVMLFLFLTTTMFLLLAVVFVPLFTTKIVLKIPEIPATFETFVEWITGILVSGSAIGKGFKAFGHGDCPGNDGK